MRPLIHSKPTPHKVHQGGHITGGEIINNELDRGLFHGRETVFNNTELEDDSFGAIGGNQANKSISERRLGISLIIPAYNEADRICRALDSYIPALDILNMQYEILVIIDGKDETQKIVEGYKNQKIRCYKYDNKLGRGGAILKGFEVSTYSIVGYTDADGSLSPEDLPTLVGECAAYDCVVGSRWIHGSKWKTKEPLFNSLAGRIYNLLIRGMLGIPISDTEGGGKFFRGNVIDATLPKIKVTNRAFTASLYYHVRSNRFSITEVPITWDHDGNTRMPILKAIPIMFITLVGVRIMNLPFSSIIPHSVIDFFSHKFATV